MTTEKDLHQPAGIEGSVLPVIRHTDTSSHEHLPQDGDGKHLESGHLMDPGNEEIEHADPFTVDDFYDHKRNAHPLEVYLHHAALERAREASDERPIPDAPWIALIKKYVLGIITAPMTFRQLGYGPGILVFTGFFLLAFLSGQILWRLYLRLDSAEFPITCYGDLGERTFGRAVRHVFNILQSIQLIFNVGIILVGDGQTLSALISDAFCYFGLNGFFAIAGLLLSQMKSLRNVAWFTNMSIWLSITVMVLTMIATGLYPPDPSQSGYKDLSQPIERSGWTPSYNSGWYAQITGVQLAIFSYGGAMIFTEFMTEMRRPRDFWKSAFIAQAFVWLMYMTFGLFCYSMQGQYTAILPMINFTSIVFQAVTNFINVLTMSITALLYANIGVKVFYQNVLREYFKAPPLHSRKGGLIWSITVTFYWGLAWLVGAAVPDLLALVTIVGAVCTLQFTFTFPPLLLLGHWVQTDALEGDANQGRLVEGKDPLTERVDTWRDLSRWRRGFKRYWWAKTWLLIQTLCSLGLSALGMYAGIESAKEAYAKGGISAFSCISPGSDASVGN
ncbi:hypothetical protein Q8F55_006126 [Vanrija albida]|uniref:Amino acid transporter transmembrane domain-containing protein n=1 Tax=Vanrija albida TaxID=181172 RepID=A0ABR3PW77_9TREE